ncbi:MAG TPA: tetratricopeptide repeat protein [Novosphingobium sp.]|nr:tetratricopeptide repeat protein [Novosphingobium sp.]
MKKLLILPALLALSACADSPEDAFAKAKAGFAARDYVAARVHLAAYLSAHPDNKEALLMQARTLLALGDGDGAQAALAKLTGGKPPAGELAELSAEAALLRGVPDVALDLLGASKGPEAERLRALAALQKNDPGGAQGHFEAALSAGGNARVFADYARFHLIGGAVAEAEAMAAKAEKADPDGIDTLLVLGQLSVRRGDLAKALGYYERASKLYPASLAALIGQAAVLGDLGRHDEMKAVIDRAAGFAPKHPQVVFLKARAAAGQKDWKAVRETVQPLEAGLAPADPLRVLYGEALLRLGQAELAIAQLQPVLRVAPGNRDAALLLAEALLARGDARQALAVLKPFADSPAARTEELALAAKSAKSAGDPSAAGYEKRAAMPPVQAAGRDLADADAAMKAGNWAGAAQAYDRILKTTDGRHPLVLNNMAYAQLMLGNLAAARDYADRALKEAPNHPSVLDTAGWVRFKSGKDLQEARRLLRRAAELAPGNPAIRAHLAEAERAGG